ALQNRIELVIVAASAVDGQTEKRLPDGTDDVFQFLLTNALPHESALLGGADFVPRPGDEEAGGDDAFRRDRLQHIAGDLLPDKLRIRLILIKGANDVIAVAPGVLAQLVALEALTFAEAHDVKPVPAPPLAVMRRGQETIHQPLDGLWRDVID